MKTILLLLLFNSVCFAQTQYKTIVVIRRVLPTTTVDLIANKKYAPDLKEFKANNEALDAGLKINEWYRLPTTDGKILITIVVPREVTPVGFNGSIEPVSCYLGNLIKQ
jgi:hypothetical protein